MISDLFMQWGIVFEGRLVYPFHLARGHVPFVAARVVVRFNWGSTCGSRMVAYG